MPPAHRLGAVLLEAIAVTVTNRQGHLGAGVPLSRFRDQVLGRERLGGEGERTSHHARQEECGAESVHHL